MMRETTPLSLFQKQNPIYAKLVVLFVLLSVTIFLYSSRSIDYSNPPLQNPTPIVSNSIENDVLITSHAKDFETQPSSEFDSQELEIEPLTVDEDLETKPSSEFDLQESEIEPLTVDEGSPSTSSSNELHKDEAKPEDEAKPDNEAKPEVEAKPNDEAKLNDESKPEDEAKPNDEAKPEDEAKPNDEAKPEDEAKPNDEAKPEDEAKPNDEAKPEDEAKPNDEEKPKCNLFKGNWVPNPKGPAYNNFTCNYIEGQQNCLTNGRPDTGYLYWRWKPRDCELPKFHPERFLNFMKNKTFAFIGDSINRNHVQSLLCILSQVEEPKIIYRDEQFKSTTFFFPSYNFTLARVWAPFLLKAETFEDNYGVSSGDIQLDLDKLEENWTNQYKDFDFVIIGGGQWFFKRSIYHENNQVQGCHYCPGRNLTELGFDYAYRKAINRVLTFITSSSPKTQVLFRTITPSHFENGQWDEGGICKRKVPFKGNEINITESCGILYDIEMQEFDKASSVASKKGITLKLFDSTQLSLLRPDGHPGPYRDYQPFAKDKNAKVQNDCLHWCLPGPIDTWNELVFETLMNG